MSRLAEAVEIFKKIEDTSSSSEKISIIRNYKDNQVFIDALRFLLDSAIVTGISKKKYDKVNPVKSETEPFGTEEDFYGALNYLKENNTGRDCDIFYVKNVAKKFEPDTEEFIKGLILKNIKLGVDYKSANKAIPGLIKAWEVQQAYPLSDKNAPKPGTWICLSHKLNGNNCGFLDGKLISRQGKEFTGLDHIKKDIKSLPFKDMFFNGELIRKNTDNLPDDENFQIGTGIINSDDINKACIKFVIYEMFPKEEFLSGTSKLTYKKRREQYLIPLREAIDNLHTDNLEVVEYVYEGTDHSKIQSCLEEADAKGWEGLMLNKDTKWENKRNNGILKVKTFKHCDIICKGVVEGDGKYQGLLGNIVCDYKGYELGVGSGFTDAQRKKYWEFPEEIVGKVVTVKYKTETKNKDGGISVQFPTFICVREEGKEVSYNG